jgi:hypothetical protein
MTGFMALFSARPGCPPEKPDGRNREDSCNGANQDGDLERLGQEPNQNGGDEAYDADPEQVRSCTLSVGGMCHQRSSPDVEFWLGAMDPVAKAPLKNGA